MRSVWLVLLLLVPNAAAVDEEDAAALHPEVVKVWHEPSTPAARQQWQGGIQFKDPTSEKVLYQICRVGQACFIRESTHSSEDRRTFTFDTSNVDPLFVEWGVSKGGEDWLVGYKFELQDGNKTRFIPEGLAYDSPECQAMGFLACDETHYFTFQIPGDEPRVQGAPLPIAAALAGLLIALVRRRP